MSVADLSIDPKIIESARKHFLSQGFQGTSLREICKDAGVTTGSLYKRYNSKEALFTALVQDTVDAIDDVITHRSNKPITELTDDELKRSWYMDTQDMLWWMEFLYQNRDGFTLLLKCSEGSSWASYPSDIVSRMADITWGYWLEIRRRGLSRKKIQKEDMHILLSSFWTTIYEPFLRDYDWSRIEQYCDLICRLFDWFKVLGLKRD